ncbi:MAG: hypothetical protein ABSD20_07140 [Terriglobales bacterium]|jgi:phosphoglycerol transferase
MIDRPPSQSGEIPTPSRLLAGRLEPLFLVVQGILIFLIILMLLHVRQRDFSVPLRFTQDSLQYQMISKTTSDMGWWWFNPRQSAPFGLDVVAYPINCNVDQSIVWLVHLFSSSPGFCINIAWCLMVALAGVLATFSLHRLGASFISSLLFGTLYAFLPYSLYRDIDFFHMSTYLLPLPCAIAILLATNKPPKPAFIVPVCVLIGLNYTYNSFFGCFFILIGVLIGYFNHRNPRIWKIGLAAILLTSFFAALNLAPSFYLWVRDGRPHTVFFKPASDAERFGLKIRHLISPVLESTFPPFHKEVVQETEARFPLETENQTARLGAIPSVGFLLLIVVIFVPALMFGTAHGDLVIASAQLSLAGVLWGTIGGFGSLFNLLVATDIRCYNRLAPLIGFFSLVGLAVVFDRFQHWMTARTRSILPAIVAAGLMCWLGIADQGGAVARLNRTRESIAHEFYALKAQVGKVESSLPAESLVYQMPFRVYLGDEGTGKMEPYAPAKPYLVSRTLHWSFPDIANQTLLWHMEVARRPVPLLLPTLRSAGFSAVWLDRYGYEDDGAATIQQIESTLGQNKVITQDSRFVVFDIRSLGDPAILSKTVPQPAKELTAVTSGMAVCPGEAAGSLDEMGGHDPQIIHQVGYWEGLEGRGWAAWGPTKDVASGVEVAIDGYPYPAFYGLTRTDVMQAFGIRAYRDAGFRFVIPRRQLTAGQHSMALRVVSPDGKCYQVLTERQIAIKF